MHLEETDAAGAPDVRSVGINLDWLAGHMQAAGEAGHIDQSAAETEWGAAHPTLARITELERLEGSPVGPLHAGETGSLAELLHTLLGDSDPAPAGDGLAGYTTPYVESSGGAGGAVQSPSWGPRRQRPARLGGSLGPRRRRSGAARGGGRQQ